MSMTDDAELWQPRGEDEGPRLRNATTRFFAVLMTVGGVLGLATTLLGSGLTLAHSWFAGIMTVLVTLLFVWSSAVGIGLWRGTRFGRRWAPVVFAAQVPILALPVLHFYWFTGLTIGTVIVFGAGDTLLDLILRAGATARFTLLPGGDRFGLGVNLFSLAAAVILYRTIRSLERTDPG